jgi:hypothetical protein
MALSDNVNFELDPSPTANPVKQKIDLIVQGICPNTAPGQFRFKLECRMLGGPPGDVIQSLRLLNYQTGMFELVDMRVAPASEDLIDIDAGGDLSRFVQPTTGEVTAVLNWASLEFSGAPFFWTIQIDQAVWMVDPPPAMFNGGGRRRGPR